MIFNFQPCLERLVRLFVIALILTFSTVLRKEEVGKWDHRVTIASLPNLQSTSSPHLQEYRKLFEYTVPAIWNILRLFLLTSGERKHELKIPAPAPDDFSNSITKIPYSLR